MTIMIELDYDTRLKPATRIKKEKGEGAVIAYLHQ